MILYVPKKAQNHKLETCEVVIDINLRKAEIYYWFGPVRVKQRTRKFSSVERLVFIKKDEKARFKSNCNLWNCVVNNYEN